LVLLVISYKTEEEAIRITNDTSYVYGYVSSANPDRAGQIAKQIIASQIMINKFNHNPYAPLLLAE
jgi:acyl-CoA reductase-like NAD-dependent aldehyde dehydrogenase